MNGLPGRFFQFAQNRVALAVLHQEPEPKPRRKNMADLLAQGQQVIPKLALRNIAQVDINFLRTEVRGNF